MLSTVMRWTSQGLGQSDREHIRMEDFSVVIPLHNKASYVRRAVQSVLGQTVRDFELIVVDDGSTDDGARVVEAIQDPRIRLVHQPNAGASAARNRGIAEAHADLVSFLDADDEWLPDYLQTVMTLKERFPNAAAWATPCDSVSSSGVLEPWKGAVHIIEGDPTCGIINYFNWTGLGPVTPSSTTVRKAVLVSIGGFPVGLACGEDGDTWLRLALRYPIAWSAKSKAIYHRDVLGQIDHRKYIWDGVPPYFESLRRFIDEKGGQQFVSREIVDRIMRKHRTAFEMNLATGNRRALSRIAKDFRSVRGYYLRGLVYQLLSFTPSCACRVLYRTKRFIGKRSWQISEVRPLYPGAGHGGKGEDEV